MLSYILIRYCEEQSEEDDGRLHGAENFEECLWHRCNVFLSTGVCKYAVNNTVVVVPLCIENSCSSDLYPDTSGLSIYWCGHVMSRSCQWVYLFSLASCIILSYGNPLLKSSLPVLQCDVFLSHPQSGILMAFHILGIHPMKAAVSPERVSRNLPPFINRHEDLVMSQADSNVMAKFRQVSHYLSFCPWR